MKLITSIADQLKAKPEDILLSLAEYNIVWATVSNVTLLTTAFQEGQGFAGIIPCQSKHDTMAILLPKVIVIDIALKGKWGGKDKSIMLPEVNPHRNNDNISENELKITISEEVIFKEEVSLTSSSLFVFEADFLRIEQKLKQELNIAESDLINKQLPNQTSNIEEELGYTPEPTDSEQHSCKSATINDTPPQEPEQPEIPPEEEVTPQLTPSEKALLWEKALQKELDDFTYGKKKNKKVFKRQLTDFINIKIRNITSLYKLSPVSGGNRKNIARDMKEVKDKIVPYMIEKYPDLPQV